MAKSYLITLGIIVAIAIIIGSFVVTTGETVSIEFIGMISIGGNVYTNFNFGIALMITIFVIGIVGIREDLKLMLQHGIGRYTTYFSTLLSGLITGAAMGLVCEIMNMAARFWPVFPMNIPPYSAAGFISGWVLLAAGFFFAGQLGIMISLIYYRLKRFMQIVFSVAAGATIIFTLPFCITFIFNENNALGRTLQSIASNPFALACLIFLLGATAAAANFLLLRRAQVKE